MRWLLLLSLIIAMVKYFQVARGTGPKQQIGLYALISMIIMHLQAFFGLILYFVSSKVVFEAASMKDSLHRFYLVEHIAMMLIAAIIITIGYAKSKKQINTPYGAKKILVYYLVALIVILAAIPWPFRDLGGAWF